MANVGRIDGSIMEEIQRRSKRFRTFGGDGGDGETERQRYMALALCGEAGELANFVKKEWRDGSDHTDAIAAELGDIFVYWVLCCEAFGFEPSGVAADANIKAERKIQGIEAIRAAKSDSP